MEEPVEESPLELEIKRSRFSRIFDKFKQFRYSGDLAEFSHYLKNAVGLVFGREPKKYEQVISPNNILVGSYLPEYEGRKMGVPPGNIITTADLSREEDLKEYEE